jgi:uncharacterized membrane protein YraQ (UPF0718 family)
MSLTNTLTDIFTGIAGEMWGIFLDAAPYLFLGFGVAGLLHIFIPDEKIMDYLGASAGKFRSVINASIAGIPLPICSCGIVPTAFSLRKRGATRGATVSFLISTPETGVDSIAITYALLDPIMTVFRPIAAFVTALAAGITNNMLIKDEDPAASEETASCHCSTCSTLSEDPGFAERIYAGIRYAYLDLLGEISGWLIVGILLAGIISYAIPDSSIHNYLGGGLASMLIMLVLGIPLYICATASTPIAAALIAKGMSPGTAFVFLLAGPATNAVTITMVARFLGKRSVVLYLAVIAICSIAFGLALDFIYLGMGIATTSIVGSMSEVLPQEVKMIFAVLMLPMMAYATYRSIRTTHLK